MTIVHYLPGPYYCVFFMAISLLNITIAALSMPDMDGIEMHGTSWGADERQNNMTDDLDAIKMFGTSWGGDDGRKNITFGSFSGSLSATQHEHEHPFSDSCECGKCNKKKNEESIPKTILRAIIRNSEARTAYILALARKQCREQGFIGQIEIAANICFLNGSSVGTGAWTQMEEYSGTELERINTIDEFSGEENILTKAIYYGIEGVIKLSLSDMAERAAVWQDPDVFSHAAMDRSAITRNLVIKEPFLGLLSVRLYFRLWLTDFTKHQ